MKKQLLIILLLIFSLSLSGQKGFVRKTSTPCTLAMTDTVLGKWINPPNYLEKEMNKSQAQEVAKQLNAITKIIMNAYPVPTGADAAWGGTSANSSFADQVKYVMNQNQMLNEEKVKSNPVSRLHYNLILYPYYCSNSLPNLILNIFPVISGGTGISIQANELSILIGNVLKEEGMTIDGRPIKYKMPTMGKWKGYDIMTPEGGTNETLFTTRLVLISRNGMLPYIPVTRKQYLDLAIPYVTKWYDKMIAGMDQIPDKTTRDEYKKGTMKEKNTILKRYQDELEETIKNGLLDSPAIVNEGPVITNLQPIFSTEAAGGRMLVTENPNYFRKDLPKYVPQFFVLKWSWSNEPWSLRFKKAIEENFQIGNLMEMIDK
ncbi:MAG: hypothetical protein ABIW38_02295 [Ferruginibacter sp.]